MMYHARMRFQRREVGYDEVCSGICNVSQKADSRGQASTQTDIGDGIKQATSKADAAMLGAGYTPTGMRRLPWLTLVRDQAGASELLGNILVDRLHGISSDET